MAAPVDGLNRPWFRGKHPTIRYPTFQHSPQLSNQSSDITYNRKNTENIILCNNTRLASAFRITTYHVVN